MCGTRVLWWGRYRIPDEWADEQAAPTYPPTSPAYMNTVLPPAPPLPLPSLSLSVSRHDTSNPTVHIVTELKPCSVKLRFLFNRVSVLYRYRPACPPPTPRLRWGLDPNTMRGCLLIKIKIKIKKITPPPPPSPFPFKRRGHKWIALIFNQNYQASR